MSKSLQLQAAVRTVDPDRPVLRALVSTRQVDRYGSIILPEAFAAHMERYMANPVILWSHNSWAPPIGRALSYAIVQDGLELEIEFATSENPLAAQLWALFRGEFLRAFSVGGLIHQVVGSWSKPEEKLALPDYARAALDDYSCDYVITSLELTEVSACSVPANPAALKRAAETGVVARGLIERLQAAPAGFDLAAAIARIDSALQRLAPQPDPDIRMSQEQFDHILRATALAARS